MVPMIRELGMTLKRAGIVKTAGDGNSMLTASILLGMMILPTIIGCDRICNQKCSESVL